MNIHFEKDPEKYLKLVESLLLEKEACNNLMLGILSRIVAGHSLYEGALLGYVEKNGVAIFPFMQTPPNNWIFPDLEVTSEDVTKEVAAFLWDKQIEVPGILGPDFLVKPFVEEWEKWNKVTSTIHMKQLIYQLDKVNPIPSTAGELVVADNKYHQLITEWLLQFGQEANEVISREDADHLAIQFLNDRSTFLWLVDGKPVSMVNRSRKTKNGATVNAVYTPDNYKRRGYATSSVAALTSKLLSEGAQFCSLYTDADYPTSNRVYKKIGYYEVGTSVVYEFTKK
ncbi:GNAT family N-acetyltransferase [Virgibacillus necropolis]|uniref:GNAT family N-acetyltransferase n=1 Tax=Virgibacillus necropolis TaxID=163877 RepID=A0A221M8Q1_9BACI|nr:GNAT family N-acetyltransferase [Virgibacillus necropolis]ASN03995.1 GNAT family N-acetyltransferase [Virgibacillus necropolis]